MEDAKCQQHEESGAAAENQRCAQEERPDFKDKARVLPTLLKSDSRAMHQVFADAKDRWKVDGGSMKSFYLHSPSDYLYCWDQPTGILYEFEQSTGQCQTVWTSAVPAVNAEIWTVLPMPPTDPASLQAAYIESGVAPSADVYAIVTISHVLGCQLPATLVEETVLDFCARLEFSPAVYQKLRSLSAAGQCYMMQTFQANGGNVTEERFIDHMDKNARMTTSPWGTSASTLIVPSFGAILGRCCPDLDALCREDPQAKVAHAHCKISSEQNRFFVCDLATSEEGTLVDGQRVGKECFGPLKTGSVVSLGPLRLRLRLSEMADDSPIPTKASPAVSSKEPAAWERKVYKRPAEDGVDALLPVQQEYQDRAEMRRVRFKAEAGSLAIDGLVKKFEKVVEAERAAEEIEEANVEHPTLQEFREGNMGLDGSFLGAGNSDRAGIGFHTEMAAKQPLVPNVLDPRSLCHREIARLKTQLRFQQVMSKP